jgi:hypothetical protein
MEWKIRKNFRLGLFASAAAAALLSATPLFAANSQHVIQTGINDSEVQVQQAAVANSSQSVYQTTTNSSSSPTQIFQQQYTGTSYNEQYARQSNGHAAAGSTGGNYIQQKQFSSFNYASAFQGGAHNTIYQNQNGGGFNKAVAGSFSATGGQVGSGDSATQTQLGTNEYARVRGQYGNYNASSQLQNFSGSGPSHEGQDVYQKGNNDTALQTQYSDSYQKIKSLGYGNTAKQQQASTVKANSKEELYQKGGRNYVEQKQSYGPQFSFIYQHGGYGGNGNLAYTFQTGTVGNKTKIYQGIGFGNTDYNGKAYVDQFGAATGAGLPNYGVIHQYGNTGGTTRSTARATIKQGFTATLVYADNAHINQLAGYAKATGTVGVYAKGTGYSYALAKQLGNEEYSILRQLNAGVSGNVAYTFQSSPGHGYAGIYQGGFNPGGTPPARFGAAVSPFDGTATSVSNHSATPSFNQFATNDRAYVDQWNGAGATFTSGSNPNTNLGVIYQNTPNSTAVIIQGTKNAGVFGDTAKIYQCNGVGFACGSGAGGGGPYASRGRNPSNNPANSGYTHTNPTGVYGNDVAKIYQQNNQEYAKIVQRGLNDYMSLTQTGVGNTFTLYQTGTNNHVVQVQH